MDSTNFLSLALTYERNQAQKNLTLKNDHLNTHGMEQQFCKMYREIQEINSFRSITSSSQLDQCEKCHLDTQHSSMNETISENSFEGQIDFTPKKIHLIQKKSNIFGSLEQNRVNFKQNIHQNKITIFYFGHPISKEITYSSTTSVEELICLAISRFRDDECFDKTLIYSLHPRDYQLRFSKKNQFHQADLALDPIQFDRKLFDNFFDSLVLVSKYIKPTFEKFDFFSDNFAKNIKELSQNKIKIEIYASLSEYIGSIFQTQTDTLEPTYNYIEQKGFKNCYLSESPMENFQLTKDFEIRYLSSKKLYVKTRRYEDESEEIKNQICFEVFGKKQKLPFLALPIKENEALMYEEFDVIKINKGTKQERILGIDGVKIYNYDKDLRKNKRSFTILDLLKGNSEQTGTQKPYRMIKEILSFGSTENGFYIQYPQKKNTYLVGQICSRQKILRKLRFLINNQSR